MEKFNAFRIFTELCNNHYSSLWDICYEHPTQEQPRLSPFPLPQPWGTSNLLCVSVDVPIWDISYKLNP